MSCPESVRLGSALAACGACPPRSVSRKWLLADRITPDRCALGMEVQVRLDGIPVKDAFGRVAHVRGLRLVANVELDVPGATNDAVSAYDLRAIWSQIFLEDFTGHQYFQALDGRAILDDQFYRFGYRMIQWPQLTTGVQAVPYPTLVDQGLAVNDGIGTPSRVIDLYIPLARPADCGGSPLEGLIPLRALQGAKNGALRFTVRSTLPGSPAGVSIVRLDRLTDIDGTATPGCEVYLDLVYLDAVVVDAPWQLKSYTMTELSGMLKDSKRKTEYCWIRYFPEDAPTDAGLPGQQAVEDHDGITLQAAGSIELAGASLYDALTRERWTMQSHPESALIRSNGAQDLPIEDATGLTCLMLIAMRPRDHAVAGPVTFEYTSRPAAWTRYLHRTVGCHTKTRGDALSAQLGIGQCEVIGTDSSGAALPAGLVPASNPIVIKRAGRRKR